MRDLYFYPSARSSRFLQGFSAHQRVNRYLVLVFTLLVIEQVYLTNCEFCGHKESNLVDESESDRQLARFRRHVRLPSSHRPRDGHGRSGKTASEQNIQEHDQIVIDDANNSDKVSQSALTTAGRVGQVQSRIDCSRSAIQSANRFGTNQNEKTTQQTVDDNCNDFKTIETAVFIDQALDNKFDGLSSGLVELNKLVLTIMNQVQHLLTFSSIKIPIRIKLVLIEHLKDADRQGGPAPNPERGDIDAYLGNFCNWQHARLEREKRIWWDHAILLSGLDLYKATPSKNHSGVLGLAWVGGMCKGNYSCTINEASNLESAFVIAHELGHSLGIMHDGQRNTCDPNGFIMSERTGAGKIHWSKCSNDYLNDSINKRQLSCLDTESTTTSDPLYDLGKLRAPGQVYTINEQCKLAFGKNYTSFMTRQPPFNAVCRELWCVAGTWAKAAHPALEGSTCGEQNRICREGKCVSQA